MSSSKSSQQANTSTSDLRRVLGERAVSAENSNVTQTNLSYALDADVAGAALDANAKTVGASLDFTGSALATMLDFASKSNAQALDSLDTTANLVKDSYADAKGRGALTDKIIIGVVIVAGVIAWKALSK
ncbi:hypothetical protein [Variovorax sp. UMC13]|uniref:hypothetical protein n=1 Tax=Variovorax sp. UMC13 TaxID=1862326 RepID=UPI00160484F2|nr:hypothetical protein [Variovorax sp. UMC13]MBB1602545.1 hypothetical protein [Variovorax sp. UMC13]